VLAEPVRLTTFAFAIEAEQDNPFRAPQERKVYGLIAGIRAEVYAVMSQPRLALAEHVIEVVIPRPPDVLSPQLSIELQLVVVVVPPAPVAGVQDICKRRYSVAVVDCDVPPAFFFGFADLGLREAWPTGEDADRFAAPPAFLVGSGFCFF
jgi:hypothetical protein